MKKAFLITAYLLITMYCAADTFTNRQSGEVFQGYATGETRGGKTLVRVGDRNKAEYIFLSDYEIEWNSLGRRNQVVVLPIKNDIELECETEAFERAIKNAANQGPLLIIIEIDTPGGRTDLMNRICEAITKANNCKTAAFISGGEYGGAYSAGAGVALACDYIFMADMTAMGGATPIMIKGSEIKDVKSAFGETVGEKLMSIQRGYFATLAERRGRSGELAKAMVDKDIEVIEAVEDDRRIFISPEDKKDTQEVKCTWNKRGELLTLTGTEAVACGMADKLINSKEEIISDFGFDKPKIVLNQDTIKARRKFESTKRKFEKIYADIDYLQKDVETLSDRFDSITKLYNNEVRKLNNLITNDRSSRTINSQEEVVDKTAVRREEIKSELLKALQKLSSKYRTIQPLVKGNPDLPMDTEELEEAINSISVMRKDIKNHP